MRAIRFLFTFLLFLSFTKPTFAVNVSISSYPSSITSDSFNINVSVNGASDGNNYLRVDLFKDSSSNYFGETYNGSLWYGGSDGLQYFPISISNSSGSAIVQARLGSPTGTEYTGPGSYKLKIRRYTNSGNPASADNQTPVDITINYSLPTSIPTISPTPKPTASLTPTNTPIPSKTLTPRPTSVSLISSTRTPTPIPTTPTKNSQNINSDVLGSSTENSTPTIKEVQKNKPVASSNSNNLIGKVFIFLGVIFLSLCGIVLFWSYKKSKEANNEI